MTTWEGFVKNTKRHNDWNTCDYPNCHDSPMISLSYVNLFLCAKHYEKACELQEKSYNGR